MSAAGGTSGRPAATAPPGSRFSRWRLAGVAVLVVVVAVVVVAVTDPFGGGGGGRDVNDGGTGLQAITRQSLSSQTETSGTLGFAGSYSVINGASGTLTWLPTVGRFVAQGGVLYRVDGMPVILLTGKVPFYRALSVGMSGADVEQLNRDLVSLGYATSSELSPSSGEFSGATVDALEALEDHLGVTVSATLGLGQAVFLPVARLRITNVGGTVGGPASPGAPLLTGSSDRRVVSLQLDAAEQADVAVGDRVTITLPDNATTPGIVTSIGTVASSGQNGGSPSVPVTVRPLDPSATGSIDQAPVVVAITTGSVSNALVVPVDALLALAGGGYAVEEVSPTGRHDLVGVSLGLFDDANGLVQVSGPGLAAGQRVVVPSL
ncbi:MAG: efflux RND transporter periplasmic adaptor subunit [Solirubrobacteraceae bacterium]